MKKLFLAVLLTAAGTAIFAQEQKQELKQEQRMEFNQKLTPEQKAENQVKKMTTDLNLNPKQAEQVKTLVTARETQKAAEMEARKAEMVRMRTKMMEDQVSMKAEMKKILTADQYTKWEQKPNEQNIMMNEKMSEKKNLNQDKMTKQ